MQEARLTNYQCASDKFQGFYNELLEDITQNRIILPSIPDIVFKIRQAINDPKTDLNTLVAVLSTDIAMSARVLKVQIAHYTNDIVTIPMICVRRSCDWARRWSIHW